MLPVLRTYPHVCVVVVADDLQHRRFKVEEDLSAESAARLKERELAVCAARTYLRVGTLLGRHVCSDHIALVAGTMRRMASSSFLVRIATKSPRRCSSSTTSL